MPSGSSKWASGKRSLTLRPPAALRTEEGSHGPQGPASMRDAWRGSRGKSRECRGHSDHARRREGDQMGRFNKLMLAVLVPGLITLCACQDLVPRDTRSLLIPSLRRSEIFGFLAGFGTTFAAVPDLTAMLRRRSSAGMNPSMATIMADLVPLWGIGSSIWSLLPRRALL